MAMLGFLATIGQEYYSMIIGSSTPSQISDVIITLFTNSQAITHMAHISP
jgi:hypothetical protein